MSLNRTKLPHHWIDVIRKLPLEPLEYCNRWVKGVEPHDRGYRKACIHALSEATGLSETTIKGWGKDFADRPDYVLHTIRQADIINQVRQIVGIPPNSIQE
jgi:hypothetical protein